MGANTVRFREAFPRGRVLLPVVHPVTERDTRASIDTCVEVGVPGVFLINQGMTAMQVIALAGWARRTHPKLWIGINILGLSPYQAVEYAIGLDGLWTDDAKIDETADAQPDADLFQQACRRTGWDGLYFGGVAFKYKREVPYDKLGIAAKKASASMDVVLTSGPGTGQAARVEKVQAMREALGTFPLGLASGVSLENVADYLPYVDAYLVGTSIEKKFGVINKTALRCLHEKIAS